MQFTVGRDKDSDIVIEHSTISKHHAAITISYYDDIDIEDNASTNGTFINNRKIKKSTLTVHDQVKFGDYEPDMVSFFESLFDKYKKSKTDFSREYTEVMAIFSIYQQKKDKLINQPKGPMVIRIVLTVAILAILLLYPDLIPNDNIRFLMMGGVGLISLVMGLFGPSQSDKMQALDKLRMEYEDKLICPKCRTKLIQNNYSYYDGRKKCINEKCDARYI